MADKIIHLLLAIACLSLSIDNIRLRNKVNIQQKLIFEAYDHIIIIKNKLGLPLFLEEGENKND